MSFAKLVLGLKPGAGKVTPIVMMIMNMNLMVMVMMLMMVIMVMMVMMVMMMMVMMIRWALAMRLEEEKVESQAWRSRGAMGGLLLLSGGGFSFSSSSSSSSSVLRGKIIMKIIHAQVHHRQADTDEWKSQYC